MIHGSIRLIFDQIAGPEDRFVRSDLRIDSIHPWIDSIDSIDSSMDSIDLIVSAIDFINSRNLRINSIDSIIVSWIDSIYETPKTETST